MDYIHDYFSGFKKAGIDTVFEIHCHQGEKVSERHSFDHVDYDGLSAMLEMVRKFPAEGMKLPKVSVPNKPSLWKRLFELARWYVRFFPFKPSLWKSSAESKLASASLLFPHVSNDKMLNARLLLLLDQVVKEHLVKPTKKRMWMLPVGLYPVVLRELPPLNRVSFVELSVDDQSDVIELEGQIKRELKCLSYWGTMLTMWPARVMGQWMFSILARTLHLSFRRTGTLTNLGEWVIPGLPDDEWWSIGKGMVARMSPFLAGAVTINGKLGVSVHFHASLGWSDERALEFLINWKTKYLELSR